MSVNSNIQGGLNQPIALRLTGTSNTDLFEATDDNTSIISMSIANETGSAATISVFWYSAASTTSYLVFRSSIAANGTTIVTDIPIRLRNGDKITATADTGNALTVSLISLFGFNQRMQPA